MAALEHLEIDRARDEELIAIVENDSCSVDAVQFLAGTTFGKGNLIFRDFGKQVFTFARRDGQSAVRISRKPEMPNAPAAPTPESRQEKIEYILNTFLEDLFEVQDVEIRSCRLRPRSAAPSSAENAESRSWKPGPSSATVKASALIARARWIVNSSSMFTVILPTYNERENLERFVARLQEMCTDNHLSGRIIVVDDGSPDGTGQIADSLAGSHDNLSVIHRSAKQGIGPAYVAGFKQALASDTSSSSSNGL